MILILASERDTHARRVAQEIARLGQRALILDWRAAGTGLRASLRYAGGQVERRVHADPGGHAWELSDVTAIWTRRPGSAAIAPGILDADHRAFAAAEWHHLMNGLIHGVTCINDLDAQRAAVKPVQLALAGRAGLAVPDTLITSDPAEARAFIDAHAGAVVHKVMTSPRDVLLETRRWDERDRELLQLLPMAPTIFQRLVTGSRDIRVTIVGQDLYAAAIDSELPATSVDSRLDLNAAFSEVQLPGEVASGLRALMAGLGLTFATADLKIDDQGRFYFLELNPQGQFLYVEILTGMPITLALARLLTSAA